MKKTIAINIAAPCHEDWAQMTSAEKGKHCALCEKEVIDFTAHSNKELFKEVSNGTSLCGHFRPDQLGTPISSSPYQGRSIAHYAASLLLPVALFLAERVVLS